MQGTRFGFDEDDVLSSCYCCVCYAYYCVYYAYYCVDQMRRWADLIVIAPLSANTLAKLAVGLSDNLLVSADTSVLRLYSITLHLYRVLLLVCVLAVMCERCLL